MSGYFCGAGNVSDGQFSSALQGLHDFAQEDSEKAGRHSQLDIFASFTPVIRPASRKSKHSFTRAFLIFAIA